MAFFQVLKRQEAIQQELESSISDMDKMSALVDELNDLSVKAVNLDVKLLDKKINKMMPELGFGKEDNDRLVMPPPLPSDSYRIVF